MIARLSSLESKTKRQGSGHDSGKEGSKYGLTNGAKDQNCIKSSKGVLLVSKLSRNFFHSINLSVPYKLNTVREQIGKRPVGARRILILEENSIDFCVAVIVS